VHDVFFPLDPLWASSAIDVIGTTTNLPISDWRDGNSHQQNRMAGATSI
jgi:hypothetical protein